MKIERWNVWFGGTESCLISVSDTYKTHGGEWVEAPMAGQQQQSRVPQNGSGAISYTGMFSIGSGILQPTMPHFVPGAAIYS